MARQVVMRGNKTEAGVEVKTPQEEQGYRLKTAQPVCGNCKHSNLAYAPNGLPCIPLERICGIGGFAVDLILGTCKRHERAER